MDACEAWLILLKPFTSTSMEIVMAKVATTVDEYCGLSPCFLVLRECQALPETGFVIMYSSQEETESPFPCPQPSTEKPMLSGH